MPSTSTILGQTHSEALTTLTLLKLGYKQTEQIISSQQDAALPWHGQSSYFQKQEASPCQVFIGQSTSRTREGLVCAELGLHH